MLHMLFVFFSYFFLHSMLIAAEYPIEIHQVTEEQIPLLPVSIEKDYLSYASVYVYCVEKEILGFFSFIPFEDEILELDHFFVDPSHRALRPKLWSMICETARNGGAERFIVKVAPHEEPFYSLMGCTAFDDRGSMMEYTLSTRSRKLCIIGCGGSGTKYTAECLETLGLNVGHEVMHRDGFIGWMFAVGSHSWKKNKPPVVRFEHIFHQVRNPLNVISTWAKYRSTEGPVWSFVKAHIPEIQKEDSLIVQCAKYWYYWNLKAEQIAEYRYRVEDLLLEVEIFSSRLGLSLSSELICSIPNNTHSWKGVSRVAVTWPYLKKHLPTSLYQNVKDMALRYGYVVEE